MNNRINTGFLPASDQLYLQGFTIDYSQLTVHNKYMERCIELAQKGAGFVSPNPMVGAVLVHDNTIIGEGWHERYGQAHAEVNCIASVKGEHKILIPECVLYVSLEPCAHHGRTPPCADLIIENKIPKVVIGCRDPFVEVDGKGIEKLIASGVEVEVGILEKECKDLNKRFLTFHTKKRPYIILKWAQTKDGKIAAPPPAQGGIPDSDKNNSDHSNSKLNQNKTTDTHTESKSPLSGGRGARLLISNEYSNRLVHKWRSEEASILVGTNTALLDNPELTTRLWDGPSSIRLVADMDLRLPSSLKIFNRQVKTIVFNSIKNEEVENLIFYKIDNNRNLVQQIATALYQLNIQSVLVEGGAKLLQSFIDEGLWDEIRVITNVEHPDFFGEELIINNGLDAPIFKEAQQISEEKISTDRIKIYVPK